MSPEPVPERRRYRRYLAVAIALFLCFWATASVSDWFLDVPFWYPGRNLWADNLSLNGLRWLPPAEALLVAAVFLFLLPAVILGALALTTRVRFDPLDRWFQREDAERTVVVLSATIAIVGALFVALAFVRGADLIDDERAYLFSARLFAHGHVGLPTPPQALGNPMILLSPMWTSRYPPGQSLLLAPATWIHAEHIVLPVLAGVLVIAVWSFTRDSFGRKHATLAALIAATSPFVWAVHGTAMSFGTTTTFLAVFLAASARAERTGRAPWMTLAGFAVGYAFITRPFDAVAFAAPFALRMLWEARSAQGRARLAWCALGFVSVAWLLPFHNYLVMGQWWQMPYNAPGVAQFHIGFTKSVEGAPYVHTPLQAVGTLVADMARFATWSLAGPIGIVLVVAGAVRKGATRADVLLRATLISYFLFFLLVPAHGTWDVGPTYYYSLVPVIVPLAARGVSALRNSTRVLVDHADAARRAVSWATLLGIAIAVSTIIPLRAIDLTTLSSEILEPWETIERSDIGPAIVLVPPIDQRRAAGWSFGHPYTLTTARGDRVDLIEAASDREVADAVAYLGNKPLYVLVLDRDLYRATGHRRFTLEPFKPAAPQ